jgi:hypothetical protein
MVVILIIFRNELKLLFISDPQIEKLYTHSFHSIPLRHADDIIEHEGFITGKQGLRLLPGSSGRIVFSFDKEPRQGSLLRVWFYGDEGEKRPNEIKISTDGGRTFHQVTGSGNYIGAVFDLNSYVMGSNSFQLLFEAKNHAPFNSVVLDSIEVVISRDSYVKPPLPNIPKILGLVLLVCVIFLVIMSKVFTKREKVTCVLCVLIIVLAVYMRWNELMRISGAIINGDARSYLNYAEKMDLFSDNGFYSANFEKREPLYISVVKIFFLLFGVSGTHLRLVSFVFSLVTIYLTYKIGKEWFNEIVGLSAAFILSVHPYLINLSARGLRAEWFTTLSLLFIYYGYVKCDMTSRWRMLTTGLITGCILLTRSECLPMLVIILLLYPFLARTKWNYKMVTVTLILGISMWFPHLYSIYEQHGDPFYTVNQYARFYANREFMGKPGFPTKEEIVEKGMYAGSKITPFEYYLKLHTPWQFIKYSVVGFTKIHIKMPFSFLLGRGNLREVLFRLDQIKKEFSMSEIVSFFKLIASLLRENIWANFMGLVVFVTFLLGLIFIGVSRYWMFYIYMVFFQMQTSFLAYLGLDARLTIHSYPLIALCCGYTIYWCYHCLSKRVIIYR